MNHDGPWKALALYSYVMEKERALKRQKDCPQGLMVNIYKNYHLLCDHVYTIIQIITDVKQNFQFLSNALLFQMKFNAVKWHKNQRSWTVHSGSQH